MALRDGLEDAGYHVLDLTGRREEAAIAAHANRPHLALVNIELQGRDEGIELAAEFKAMNIPVLFISGQTSRARTAQTVAVASLPKPYAVSDVVDAVAYLLARLKGNKSLPKPGALEVFDSEVESAAAPKAEPAA